MGRQMPNQTANLGMDSTSGSTFPVWIDQEDLLNVEAEEVLEGIIGSEKELVGVAESNLVTGASQVYHGEAAERGLFVQVLEVETANQLQTFFVREISHSQALALDLESLFETQFHQTPGPVDLIQRVRQLDRAQFEREREAFIRIKPELLHDHSLRGRFIAVVHGEIVDSDVDDQALAERVYLQFGYRPVYIGFVGEELPAFNIPTPS